MDKRAPTLKDRLRVAVGLGVLSSRPNDVSLQTHILDIQIRSSQHQQYAKPGQDSQDHRWRQRAMELDKEVCVLRTALLVKENELAIVTTTPKVPKKRKPSAKPSGHPTPLSIPFTTSSSSTCTDQSSAATTTEQPPKSKKKRGPKPGSTMQAGWMDGKILMQDIELLDKCLKGNMSEPQSLEPLGLLSNLLNLSDSALTSEHDHDVLLAPAIRLIDRLSHALARALSPSSEVVINPRRLVEVCSEILNVILEGILVRLKPGTSQRAALIAAMETGIIKPCIQAVVTLNQQRYSMAAEDGGVHVTDTGNEPERTMLQLERNPVKEVGDLLRSMLEILPACRGPIAEVLALHATSQLVKLFDALVQLLSDERGQADRLGHLDTTTILLRLMMATLPHLPHPRPSTLPIDLVTSLGITRDSVEKVPNLIVGSIRKRLMDILSRAMADSERVLEECLGRQIWKGVIDLGEALLVMEGEEMGWMLGTLREKVGSPM